MNQTNIKVDPDEKKMKLDKFVVKKKSIRIMTILTVLGF